MLSVAQFLGRSSLIPNELTACFSPRISHGAGFAAAPHNLANPPGGAWGGEGWPALYVKERYAADWLGQGAGYTLQHSLAPEKPLYDTEWHSVGTLQWRDEHMSAEYVELAVWFTLYHYLAINVAWYFPREHGFQPQPASKFPGSLVGSFATLPAATDTFLREYHLRVVSIQTEMT
eukprot:COSAG01_NODE_2591_length_7409_cov_109.624077_4_plen_176_part_00